MYTTLDDGADCDDGSECTAADVCTQGVCLGDTMGCTLCPPEFENPMNIIVELAIGADGLGLISYYDPNNGDLKVAHCDDTACSSATTLAVASSSSPATQRAAACREMWPPIDRPHRAAWGIAK